MRHSEDGAIDEIRSRADLEIELARLALRMHRATAHVVEGASALQTEERSAALAEWFESIADEVLSRTDQALKPYARSRIAVIGARCAVRDEWTGPASGTPGPLPAGSRPRPGAQGRHAR